jgi:hypothetical protein
MQDREMLQSKNRCAGLLLALLSLPSCGGNNEAQSPGKHPVADDVLFLVLGKMALYDQSPTGELTLRNHHFVAEIMPKAGRKIVSGSLTSAMNPGQILNFAPEGNAFLAHGARVMDPVELHQLHPDGDYVFSYQTESGRLEAQPLTLTKRSTIDEMPAAAAVTLSQNGASATTAAVDSRTDLAVAWEPMPGNTRMPGSDLNDLIFVLAFDCFGSNVAHSGRPYQGGPYLTYDDSRYVISAGKLKPGLSYTLIVEQATADVDIFRGVPGIATYATLTFVEFQTAGETEETNCPD